MANIDSLDIRITSSATEAVRAITNLENALVSLGQSLAPAAMGLEKISIAFDQIAAHKADVKALSTTVDTLSKAWGGLTNATTKSGANMDMFSSKARTMAQTLASEWGIKGKDKVMELTNALETMYNSIGDTVGIGKALARVEDLIKTNARFKVVTDENAKALRAFVNQSSIKLDEMIKKSNQYKQIWGTLGGNVSSSGMLPSELVAEFNQKGGGALDITGLDTEEKILEKIIQTLQRAKDQTLTYNDITSRASAYAGIFGDKNAQLNETLNQLAFSVGTTMNTALGDLAVAFSQINAVSPQAAKDFMNIDMAVESLADNPDPLRGLIDGLTQISSITLSDSLSNLTFVKDAASKFSGKNVEVAGQNIRNVAEALRDFPNPDISTLPTFTDSLYKLGKAKVEHAFKNLIDAKVALEGFNGLVIDPAVTTSVQQLGDGLYKFGLAKMDKAVANLPALSSGLKNLIASLSNMPAVSENTIRLVTALGNMNVSGSALNRTMNGMNGHMKRFTGHAGNMRKASMSLATAFGKMYANFFIVFRLFNRFKKDIDLASQLTEIQNVVDVTFADMADKMNDFAKTSIETLGMSELTAKKIGSRYQAMGSAMGISNAMVKSTNDFVQKATHGYADVADSMADVSINLTRLAGDMASFYNADYADVAEDLEAVYTGMTRPLRKYGLDLTVATLSEWAMRNGMEANMKTMTQAEKTLLRYQYVMAQTTAAHKDFERTQNTWANQTRIAAERLNQLRIILGKIAIYTFKPLVQAFNRAMTTIIKGAEGLLNSLGKIFGWQVEWSDAGVLGDESDDAGELADNMGDAADNAKKFKNFLLGIDELNLLPDNSDKDKGGGSGLGGLGGVADELGEFKLTPVEKGFESIYDTLYKLGKRIAEVQKDILKSIDWDAVYKKAQKFGKGFASFLNGYFSDIELFYHKGRFLANSINTLARAVYGFFREFDGLQFGRDIGMELNGFARNLDWGIIKDATYELAHDIASAVNGFFGGVNWYDVGKMLIEGVNTAVLYASTIVNEIDWGVIGTALGEGLNGIFENWDEEEMARMVGGAIQGALDLANNFLEKADFEMIGEKIGKFLAELDILQYSDDIARLIWNLIKAGFSAMSKMFDEAPIETSLITAFAGARFLGFGNSIGGTMASSVSKAFGPKLGSLLTTDLGTLSKDAGLLKSAGLVGAGIAAAIVSAVEGYEVGKYIGKKGLGDDMWYDMSGNEMLKDLANNDGELGNAFSEMITDLFTLRNAFSDTNEAYLAFGDRIRDQAAGMLVDIDKDFAEYKGKEDKLLKESGITWGQIKDNLRMGKVEIDDAGFAKLQAMLEMSGNSVSDIKPLINQLKDAQEEYYNGFSDYYSKEENMSKKREQAYAEYKNMITTVDEWISHHPKDLMAIEHGATTYEEMFKKIQSVTHSSMKETMDSIKGLGSVLSSHDKNLDGSEKSWKDLGNAAEHGGRQMLIPMQAMADMRSKSGLAMSGIIDFSDKLKEVGNSGNGIKDISTNFTALKNNISTFNTALLPVKAGFMEFTIQTQAGMLTTAQVFGQSFSNIMKYGNQTIAWLKSSFVPYFSGAYWNSITASIPNAFGNAFRQAVNIMTEIWKSFAKWANENMKMDVKTNGKSQADIKVEIPQYSTGGFPEDGMFMANHGEMVGQFANGKTAVANNEQIVEGIRQGVYEAVMAAMQGSNGNVTVELMGDAADIFTAVVRENNRSIMRTGASPIRV